MIETQHDRKIKHLRTDQGGEYESTEFSNLLKEVRMIHKRSVPHIPQQNGLAKQFNQTILESTKSMLHAADLPLGFWGKAIKTTIYIRNCSCE
jgi:transposase InsO family protein